MRYLRNIISGVILIIFLLLSFSQANANSSSGYWRFEEGAAGGTATGSNSILDSSALGNHGTPYGYPVYRNNVPVSLIPNTGESNALSLEFDSNDEILLSSKFPFHGSGNATLEFRGSDQAMPLDFKYYCFKNKPFLRLGRLFQWGNCTCKLSV